jgi:sulfatase maturation enzyme AslB (radical SAM superfamily)
VSARTGVFRSLHLVLTSRCNQRCIYCYQTARTGARMSWDTAARALDLLLQSGRESTELVFYGGEPLLEASLLRRALRYLEERSPSGITVRPLLSTNGTLLDDAAADFLVDHRVRIQLSFDGARAAQEYRSEGSFGKLDALLSRLRRRHPWFYRDRLDLSVTLTPAAIPHLADSIRYFLGREIRRIRIAPTLVPAPDWRKERIDALRREFDRVGRICLDHYRRTGEIPVTIFRGARDGGGGRRRDDGAICAAASGESLTVDADGSVYGCVTLAESYQSFPPGGLSDRLRAMRLGSIADRAIQGRLPVYRRAARAARIFHHEEGKRSSYGRCSSCRFLDGCLVCPVSAVHAPGGDPTRLPDFPCAFYRTALAWRERFPVPPDPWDFVSGAPASRTPRSGCRRGSSRRPR